MGLPEIIIEFKTKGVTAIKRSARGIVAIVLKDDTEEGQALNIYKSVLDVDPTHFTARNYEYLKLVYEGSPSKTIVLKVATTEENLNPQLKQLNDLKWNYLVIPGITEDEKTTVAAWIKEARDDHHKTFKAVLPNCKGDHEGIINLTTDKITSTLGTTAFSTAEYCCRIAGVLAGLSLARSCTYFELSDITAAEVPEDADERIDNGELVIVFDGEKYKIGRGVNSLTSFTPEHGQDFSKIKIIEGVDLYQDDIREPLSPPMWERSSTTTTTSRRLWPRSWPITGSWRAMFWTEPLTIPPPSMWRPRRPICRARAPTPPRWMKPPWPRRIPAPRSLSPAMSSLWTRWKI